MERKTKSTADSSEGKKDTVPMLGYGLFLNKVQKAHNIFMRSLPIIAPYSCCNFREQRKSFQKYLTK